MRQGLRARFKLDQWQKDFLNTKGNKILCTGRQVGKSEICGIDAGEWAAANPNANVLIIAPTERQAYALFDKTLDHLFINHKSKIKMGKDKPTKHKITLNNGTLIWCLPAGISGRGIRFLTVHRLYIDEAAYVEREVWTATTPMLLTTGGRVILLSTPHGTEGFFYDVLSNAEQAYDNWTRFHTNSEKVIREREICKSWSEFQRDSAIDHLEREKKRMSALEYAQEYLGKPLDDLRQVFPDDLIKACMVLNRRESVLKGREYYLGVDVAAMGRDESTFEIVELFHNDTLEHVDSIVTKKTRTTDTTNTIKSLNQIYDFRKEYIDSGGLGIGVCDQLREDEQHKRKVVEINNAKRVYATSWKGIDKREMKKKMLKEELYNNLLSLMEQKRIKLLKDPELFQSLKSVQFEILNDRVRYFGNYTHIAEGLIRAAWCVKEKGLSISKFYRI